MISPLWTIVNHVKSGKSAEWRNKDVWVDVKEKYEERIQNVFSDFIYEVERWCEDWGWWFVGLFFIYHYYGRMQRNGVMHGMKWIRIGNDG